MKRAWEKHINTDEIETQRKGFLFYLDTMLHAPSPQSFNLFHKTLCTQFDGKHFITYFNETWLAKKKLWFKGWRPAASE
ncbi:hypothetical protein BD770DRAFT_469198 [Pilaira anomala]|nr:hypothetical protein BD770DRAFT_469198 [Pilaira anomala]